jgi:hypothetical protein
MKRGIFTVIHSYQMIMVFIMILAHSIYSPALCWQPFASVDSPALARTILYFIVYKQCRERCAAVDDIVV